MAEANRRVRVIFEAVLNNFQSTVRNGMNRARRNIEGVADSTEEVNRGFKSMPDNVDRVTSATQRLSNVVKTIIIGKIAKEITQVGADMVNTYGEVERGLNTLHAIGMEDIEDMKKAAIDFSNTWSGFNATDFIESANAIKSGIDNLSDHAVIKFTEMAAITAKATEATADEMTNLFAQGYEIYRNLYSSDEDYAEQFGAGIASTIKVFRTDGSEMAGMLSTLGATARTAGASLSDVLSVGGQLQATMSGSEAATVMQSFYKNAYKAGQELKLQFVDSNGQLKGMADIIDLIHAKYGNVLDAAEQYEIQQAFGRIEAVKMVTQLYDKTDLLRSRQEEVNAAMAEGNQYTQRMAEGMNNGVLDKIDKIKQRWTNVKTILGEKIAMGAMQGIEELLEKLETVQDSATLKELGDNIGRLVGLVANDLVAAFSDADGWGKKLADSIGYIADHYEEIKGMVKLFLELYIATKALSVINGTVKTISSLGSSAVKLGANIKSSGGIMAFFGGKISSATGAAKGLGSVIKWLWGLIAAHPLMALIAVLGALILKFIDCYKRTGNLKDAWKLFCLEVSVGAVKVYKAVVTMVSKIIQAINNLVGRVPIIGDAFGKAAGAIENHLKGVNGLINQMLNGAQQIEKKANKVNIKPSENTVKGFREAEAYSMASYKEWKTQKDQEKELEVSTIPDVSYYEPSAAGSIDSSDSEDKRSATEKAIDKIAEKYDYQVDLYESRADLAEAQNNTALEKQHKQSMISILKQQAAELLGLVNSSSGKDKSLAETARNKILQQIAEITQDIKDSVNNLIGSFNTPSDVSATTQYQYLLKEKGSSLNKLINQNQIEMNVSFDSLGDLTEQEAYNKLSMLANMMGLVLTSKDTTVDNFMSDVTRNY